MIVLCLPFVILISRRVKLIVLVFKMHTAINFWCVLVFCYYLGPLTKCLIAILRLFLNYQKDTHRFCFFFFSLLFLYSATNGDFISPSKKFFSFLSSRDVTARLLVFFVILFRQNNNSTGLFVLLLVGSKSSVKRKKKKKQAF